MDKELQLNILKVLTYFDFFRYPVSGREIRGFVSRKVSRPEIEHALQVLLSGNNIYKLGEFYSLQNDASLATRRRQGNIRAGWLLEKAGRISKLLSRFPFVTAIGISGSLSKNFADEKADIDYFVITKANRLWIARTIMHFFKKLTFVTGKQHYFCMNYYIDEHSLQIEEKNIYTATELLTLIPMFGNGSISKLYSQNIWINEYFPNSKVDANSESPKVPRPWYKKTIEKLLSGKAGDLLDDYLMKITTKRWAIKENNRKLDSKGDIMSLKGSKHISKPNPRYFHDKFLLEYNKRITELERVWKPSIESAPASSSK